MSVKPIRPEEIPQQKKLSLPDQVIEVFNELIVERWSTDHARFLQDEVITRLIQEAGVSRDFIFKHRWLDVEDIYREAGWDVYYDRPGYNESYEAFFTFRKRR